MEPLLSRITAMAHRHFGPGQLRTDDEGRVYWATKDGVETPLGWTLEEADFTLSALLDPRAGKLLDEDKT